ncbi:protocadherin-11 X-linked-like [Physella acuta]|uniref:protocadherin-11 X-linked-like n=1 Tax=Physella acuta TaxID=109671 RepID=UPI0027DDA426|nr:protocadherin-11 X-linked-like [Physella acuta]
MIGFFPYMDFLNMAPIPSLTSLKFTYVLIFMVFIHVGQGQSFDLVYAIEEEVPVHTIVGHVGQDSNISHLLSNEDFQMLRFRLLLYPNSDTSLFTILNTSGVLRTAARIDRETLCHYESTCKLTLHVAAQTESGQQFYTFKIFVYVKDINDNSPLFPMSTVTVTIDEDAAEFTSIQISPAVDIDILNNTIQSYTLRPPSETFELKVSRNLDDSLIPQLFVKSLLDRESRPFYFLKVVALDGGSPRRSGELTINVTLNDVNDNAPRFSQQVYDVSVDEVAPVGSRVMTLTATDDDVGQNGRIRYRLGIRQSEEAFNTFRVIAESGNIVTMRELTSLQGETMRLVVEAVDNGAKPQTAQAMVNIHIVDSINNAPAIRMTTLSGTRVSRIMENSPPGYVVAHFIVEDADSGENGEVSCHLQDDTFGLQRLQEAEYKVTVYNNLDRELVPFYDVRITCMDGGTPPMTTTVAFSVILEDANDNPPRFLKSLYRANISENSQSSFILQAEAEDLDLGQNGKVTYRLGNVTSLVSSYIHINLTTGELRTKQMLDHELFHELDFSIVAMDDGNPSLSSTVRVIIDVIDKNDNIPQVPTGFFMSIRENQPYGSVVGHIQAVDPDEGDSGKVGYQLLTDNEATVLFSLNETSGEVLALTTFDRETRDIYDINVLARDYGSNPLTNILHIRIRVTDDNDHKPVFDFPRPNNKTIFMTIDTRYNTTIANVKATDLDLGPNAALTYTLVNGGRDVFDIDPRTGRLFTVKNLFAKDKGTYNIELFVRDNGVPPLSAQTLLTIIVTQGNATAAAVGFGYSEQIIIVAILIGATVFVAVVVFLIVLRFLKKDRRDRRPKYTGGLPMEVKKRSPTPEEDASSDEGPWRRYDEAKRPNGPVVTSGDVTYDASDDIIMFKLKLADQYRELEPEQKEHLGDTLTCDDSASNRNSVISDVDCGAGMSRLGTFQSKSGMMQVAGYGACPDSKEKVWRSSPKEKMTDEILSSSSRETTGADSGRGPSEDGSQSRSSVTDESGCLISPSHSILRGNTPKHQGTYSRPPSSAYDRPPLLMTFQSNSSDNGSTSGVGSSVSSLGTRKEYSPNPYPNVPSPRLMNTYGKEYTEQDRIHETTSKKLIDDGYGTSHSGQKSFSRANGLLKSNDRLTNSSAKSRDARLCSEPPTTNGNRGITSPSYNTPVQETGLTPSPSPVSPSMLYINNTKPLMPGSADRYSSNHSQFKYPPSPSFLQTTPSISINSFKQTSCPQLYKNPNDPHSQSTLPSANRSRSFNVHETTFGVVSPSLQDMLNESLEPQDDGNTTTTSGSYTIDHDDVNMDLPQTDVFV